MPRVSEAIRRRKPGGTTGSAAQDLFAKSDPKLNKEADILILRGLLRRIFVNAAREIGAEETRQEFARYAKQPPKRLLHQIDTDDCIQMWETLGRPPQEAFAKRMHELGLGKSVNAIREQLKPNRRAKRKKTTRS